ncbi:MAG: hypothetical protein CVV49_07410 [Spirochaetae bacterium HGW-Spirochaetae-5]|nr:MAG: hypothetical protein CVV49_07410 [Spirochaetae bacterium HGW-Spirochaetae-5]
MRPGFLLSAAAVVMMSIVPLFSTGLDDIQVKKLTGDRMKLFPVPADNINYMFLQSIENDTAIVIGDFSGLEKKIIMIVDKDSDNTIDSVFEYYPLKKDLKIINESKSRFFTKDIAKLKKDIIEGAVYKGNYTDNMKSLKTLESVLNNSDTNSLCADVYGFNVRFFEADERRKNSALFTYGKNAEGYYLQFKTEYYRKDANTIQKPVLKYSVYSRDSKDPVVKEIVENLFKIKQPGVNTASAGK